MKRQNIEDVKLNCIQCHADFVWTVKEQINYTMNGYQQPKHCPTCRKKRRDQQTERHLSNWLPDREKPFDQK